MVTYDFKVSRGVRQGCALSGMLYALAIEPFLNKLRTDLYGLHIPKCPNVFKLSAYADDVILISCQNDVDLLLKLLKDFRVFSSTKVNWSKSEAILVGRCVSGEPNLPDGLVWTREGFKYLGVFLGNEVVQKNFEGVIGKNKGSPRKMEIFASKVVIQGPNIDYQ